MKKHVLAAMTAIALGAPAAFAAEQGVTDTEILIGEVDPYTGPPALLGKAHTVGVQMAFAEANATGVNGRKFKLLTEDDGYVTARTLQGVRKLIDVDKVFMITGISGTGQSTAAVPILEKAGIPTIISVAPAPAQYDPPKKNIFVIGQVYSEGIKELTRFLADKNPGKKWAIVTQDDDYGLVVREGFEAAAKEKKINVVYSADYKKGQTDFASEMLRLKESGAEVFLAGGIIGENVAMLKELEKLNYKPTIGIFWPGRIEVVLKLAGPASDGIFAVDYVEPLAGPAGKAFLEKAKNLLPEADVKAINRYSEAGYATGRVIVEAAKRCGAGLTRDCMISEIEKTKNLETGVMAPITFGAGQRFSNQKVQIMQADYGTLSYKPVQ
ncbi:MAG: ABC transporter substrate-binding protein [Beijerinckiaceae bacterium]